MAIAFLCAAQFSHAEDTLPPIHKLIAETLALCHADPENNTEALAALAEAQAHLGDFAAARKTLASYRSEDFRHSIANLNCAQIEIQRIGSIAAIPDSLWNYSGGTLRCKAALAFVERGEIEKTLEQIDQVPKPPNSSLNVFGVELIEKLKDRDANEAGRKVALAWASRLNQAEEIGAYRSHYQVPRLVAWLVEFKERAVASALCDHWHSVLKAQTAANEADMLLGKSWAEFAKALAALDDKETASRALDQAEACLEKSLPTQLFPVRRGFYRSLAPGYAAAAARRAVIFDQESAHAAYSRAYEFASLSIDTRDPRFGDMAFELIVDEQLTAGDHNGVPETIKRAPTLRSAARCWLRISSRDLARGDKISATNAVRAASDILDRDGFESFVAEDMALVASIAATLGEEEIARKLFQRAVALSDADKAPKSMYPFIASFQAHGGLLSDAYQTIQSIPKPADRAKPLAHLCLALAKADSRPQKPRP